MRFFFLIAFFENIVLVTKLENIFETYIEIEVGIIPKSPIHDTRIGKSNDTGCIVRYSIHELFSSRYDKELLLSFEL